MMPIAGLTQLIRAGWGDIPGLCIPADVYDAAMNGEEIRWCPSTYRKLAMTYQKRGLFPAIRQSEKLQKRFTRTSVRITVRRRKKVAE